MILILVIRLNQEQTLSQSNLIWGFTAKGVGENQNNGRATFTLNPGSSVVGYKLLQIGCSQKVEMRSGLMINILSPGSFG